jgi:ATP-dependent Clp protease protease subunit
MIHQPSGGFRGQATDISIQAEETLRIRDTLERLMAKHTRQPLEQVRIDTERDRFMSAVEAKDYGLIDEVIHARP